MRISLDQYSEKENERKGCGGKSPRANAMLVSSIVTKAVMVVSDWNMQKYPRSYGSFCYFASSYSYLRKESTSYCCPGSLVSSHCLGTLGVTNSNNANFIFYICYILYSTYLYLWHQCPWLMQLKPSGFQ